MFLLTIGTVLGLFKAWERTTSERQRIAELAEAEANLRIQVALEKQNGFHEMFASTDVARIAVGENGLIDEFSEGAAKLTGVPANEAIGKTLGELNLVSDQDAAQLSDVPAGKVLPLTLPVNRVGKKPVMVEIRSKGVSTAKGRALLISFDRVSSMLKPPASNDE